MYYQVPEKEKKMKKRVSIWFYASEFNSFWMKGDKFIKYK